MAISLQWLPYGRPVAIELADEIMRLKGDDPLAPVNVVVPSNHVGVTVRRLIGSGELVTRVAGSEPGLVGVTFLTVYRLAELLAAATLARAGRRPVSTPILTAALRRAIAEDAGVFRPVADHPATEASLVGAYRELRDCSEGASDALAATSRRARDVVRLHRSARRLLMRDYYDEEDLIEGAIQALAIDTTLGGLGAATVAYLPHRLSRHGGRLLAAVGARTQLSVLAGFTGDPAADAETALAIRRIGFEHDGLASSDAAAPVSTARTRIVSVSDPDEEVRVAVRAVIDAARSGLPLDRIAVLYPIPRPYPRLIHEQLDAAGILHNGTSPVPLTERLAGRSLLRLLNLPSSDFRRDEVFAWLSGATLHWRGRQVPVTAWERRSRDAGVVSGREDWDRLLERMAQAGEQEAERLDNDSDAPQWKAQQRRDDANRARSLREFVLDLIDDLSAASATPRLWSEHASWALSQLTTLLPERRRNDWPLAEQKAAERVERAIGRLAALDALEGAVGLDVFVRTLEIEFEADLGRVGRLGEGVLVGPLSFGPGSDLSLLIVVGLAEGSLPLAAHEDSLLPDVERETMDGELPLRRGSVDRQHHDFLASLFGAQQQLILVPRGDLRRGSANVPSRWVLEIASELAETELFSEDLLSYAAPWVKHVASHEAGLRQLEFPATSQEYRMRALLAQGARPRIALLNDEVLSTGGAVVVARRSSHFTRFDGHLEGLTVPSPLNGATSATRLETWARCPIAYLLSHILGVEEVENPEDRLRISPLDFGSLVHEVLERFIAAAVALPEDERLQPAQPWPLSDHELLREIANEVCARYEAEGLVGRPIFWRRDRSRLIGDLERLLREDDAHRAASFTRPLAAELTFGLPGASIGPVELRLADSRIVKFRGRADRLDLSEDGSAEVIDYKTGRVDDYRALSEQNPDEGGRRLQLVVYALAARAQLGEDVSVHSAYWFVSTRGNFRRIGYDVTDAVMNHVARTVGQIVAGIEAGVFPNHPTATSTTPYVECAYCDPDGLGVADLRRQFERKATDPALRPFLELTNAAAAQDGANDGD